MYKKIKANSTTININEGYVGERIEEKIERIINNNEPISDGAPVIFTERKEGVMPEYDIRTDRFEIALDAMEKISKSHKAKRENKGQTQGEEARENMKIEKQTETKNNPGTGNITSDKL